MRIVGAAIAVSYTGTFLGVTALVLTLQGSGASGWAVAGLLLASLVPPVLLAPVAGRLVDRMSSRTLLVTVGAAQAATGVALAFATHPAAIVGLMALLAVGLAITSPTLQALLPDIVGPSSTTGRDNLSRASATVQSAAMFGTLGGPALAGVLVGQYGTRVPLLVNAATYLAIVAAGLTLRTVRRGAPTGTDAAAGSGGGARVVRRDPLLLVFTVLLAGGIGVLTADNVAGVYLVRDTLGASTTTYGLLETTWSVAMLAGAWLLGRVVVSDRGLLLVTAGHVVLASAVELFIAVAPVVWWLVPAYLVGGLGNGLSNTARGVLVGRRAPAALRGRVIAFLSGVFNGAVMGGYLLGGALTDAFGPRATYAVAGGLGFVVAAVFATPTYRAFRTVGPGRTGEHPQLAPSARSEAGRDGVSQATPAAGVR